MAYGESWSLSTKALRTHTCDNQRSQPVFNNLPNFVLSLDVFHVYGMAVVSAARKRSAANFKAPTGRTARDWTAVSLAEEITCSQGQ